MNDSEDNAGTKSEVGVIVDMNELLEIVTKVVEKWKRVTCVSESEVSIGGISVNGVEAAPAKKVRVKSWETVSVTGGSVDGIGKGFKAEVGGGAIAGFVGV